MEHFLINSSICLFVLWLFYKLALENTSWHKFKRSFLLFALFFSMAIPFVTTSVIEVIEAPQIIESSSVFFDVPIENEWIAIDTSSENSTIEKPYKIEWQDVLWAIYLIVAVVMLFRFLINLYKLLPKAVEKRKSFKGQTIIYRKNVIVPHSFLKWIYLNDTEISETVLQHELEHVKQKHSFDNLLLELLHIVLWFQPMIYLFKYSIKLNHEFLVDATLLQKGIKRSVYQEILLNYSNKSRGMQFANTFNFPLIKKRLIIMNTKTSTKQFLLRSFIILPLITLLAISCGKEKENIVLGASIANQEQIIPAPQKATPKKKTTQRIYAEEGEIITPEIYYKHTSYKVYEKGIQYRDTIIGENLLFDKKYNEFTKEDREKYRFIIATSVPKPESPKLPTNSEMKEFLNANVFRIWIDGKEVNNNVLANYQPEDFKNYSGRMFVHKTGRKVHKQAFNVQFHTAAYYEKKNYGKQLKYDASGAGLAKFEKFEKKDMFFKSPVRQSFNLPQKVIATAAYNSNNKFKYSLDNKPFTWKEIITKLKDLPNAKVILNNEKGNSFLSVATQQKMSDSELNELLNQLK